MAFAIVRVDVTEAEVVQTFQRDDLALKEAARRSTEPVILVGNCHLQPKAKLTAAQLEELLSSGAWYKL